MIKTFLITGATKGLGRSIALHLAKLNYRVYAVGRTLTLLDDLAKESSFITPICADITNANDLDKIEKVVSRETSFSIIHNAAVVVPRLFANDQNGELLKKQIETNFLSPLCLTRRLLPYLSSDQRVLHISSQAANLSLAGLSAYCISKSALEHAVRCLNEELRDRNIYFSILRPGMLDTPMQDQFRSCDIIDLPGKDFYINSFEEKKLRNPEDVAKFIAWVMLSTANDMYVNTLWDINSHDTSLNPVR